MKTLLIILALVAIDIMLDVIFIGPTRLKSLLCARFGRHSQPSLSEDAFIGDEENADNEDNYYIEDE